MARGLLINSKAGNIGSHVARVRPAMEAERAAKILGPDYNT